MQPRIPRQSPRDRAAHGPGDVPGLGAEATAALAAARRRALRDGDRQVDTAHLLHSLLEHDPLVRAAFGGGPQLARLLGYLVQRSIGYGLRWQSGVEDSGAPPAVTAADPPARTSAAPRGAATVGAAAFGAAAVTAVEGLSPLAAAAMERACEESARRTGAPARGVDLLAAMVADPRARAVEVLTHVGVDPYALRAGIEDGLQEREGCLEGGSPAC
ncbi:Clp protease N-terminal domain-containing protein [Streptomyces hilarionis]|uniref:Clp protease N-terminal domain-containing protein n=1 Tax=Streptomyces hilarionis TaxID=2839954 RepID=UPI00211A33DE|nr:Clp protease N-terminal domain-containing protein [Streptomyces hilarionis]